VPLASCLSPFSLQSSAFQRSRRRLESLVVQKRAAIIFVICINGREGGKKGGSQLISDERLDDRGISQWLWWCGRCGQRRVSRSHTRDPCRRSEFLACPCLTTRLFYILSQILPPCFATPAPLPRLPPACEIYVLAVLCLCASTLTLLR
jgi:hypothetical protein